MSVSAINWPLRHPHRLCYTSSIHPSVSLHRMHLSVWVLSPEDGRKARSWSSMTPMSTRSIIRGHTPDRSLLWTDGTLISHPMRSPTSMNSRPIPSSIDGTEGCLCASPHSYIIYNPHACVGLFAFHLPATHCICSDTPDILFLS